MALVEQVRVLPADWLLLSSSNAMLSDGLHHTPTFRPQKSPQVEMHDGKTATVNLAGCQRMVDEPCVLLGGSHSHYHWLFDFLPRMISITQFRELAQLKLVVSAAIGPAQIESLRLLGVEESRLLLVEPTEIVRFETLWVPSLYSEYGRVHPAALAWLRDSFVHPAASAEPAARLYVSRSDASCRRRVNELEIREKLEARGFETIIGSNLGFAEQVAKFAAARIVFGVTGAGLSNIVFSPTGATVVELHNFEDGAVFFQLLAEQLGHQYFRINGQYFPAPGVDPHNFDFRVSPDQLPIT
jgi:capsular polysaccharide biosynthesis protein